MYMIHVQYHGSKSWVPISDPQPRTLQGAKAHLHTWKRAREKALKDIRTGKRVYHLNMYADAGRVFDENGKQVYEVKF